MTHQVTAEEVLKEYFDQNYYEDEEALKSFILSAMKQAADAVIVEEKRGANHTTRKRGIVSTRWKVQEEWNAARQDQITRRDNFFKNV